MPLLELFVRFVRCGRDERGATAVEYGLMVAMIAIVIISAVAAFGVAVSDLFEIPAGVFGRP